MHTMKRFVQERERKQPARPGFRHDAAGRASRRVTAQPDVLDVFPPALKISSNHGGTEEDPQKIVPDLKPGDRGENGGPHQDYRGVFDPDSTADLFVFDERILLQEDPQKQERREQDSEIQLDERRQAPCPARRRGDDEGPEFDVAFRRQMGVMFLMGGPIEREAHETQGPGEEAVEIIEPPVRPQIAVGGFVEPDQQSVHEVAD